MTPKRIQRKRTKGWRKPPGAVCVSRPSRWGNPWTIKDALESKLFKPEACARIIVKEFREWLTADTSSISEHLGYWKKIEWRKRWMLDHLDDLRGKDLACWCKMSDPCHADVLLELANREETK